MKRIMALVLEKVEEKNDSCQQNGNKRTGSYQGFG